MYLVNLLPAVMHPLCHLPLAWPTRAVFPPSLRSPPPLRMWPCPPAIHPSVPFCVVSCRHQRHTHTYIHTHTHTAEEYRVFYIIWEEQNRPSLHTCCIACSVLVAEMPARSLTLTRRCRTPEPLPRRGSGFSALGTLLTCCDCAATPRPGLCDHGIGLDTCCFAGADVPPGGGPALEASPTYRDCINTPEFTRSRNWARTASLMRVCPPAAQRSKYHQLAVIVSTRPILFDHATELVLLR